jgi:hypothetical protein
VGLTRDDFFDAAQARACVLHRLTMRLFDRYDVVGIIVMAATLGAIPLNVVR